jgi:hypothetical protein
MSTSYLGLSGSSSRFAAPAAFLGWGWFYAYCVLASRTWKQWYGIDHNGSPRQDLNKYADAAVRDGKLTRKQVEQLKRVEAASANATEGYTLFAASGMYDISFLRSFVVVVVVVWTLPNMLCTTFPCADT